MLVRAPNHQTAHELKIETGASQPRAQPSSRSRSHPTTHAAAHAPYAFHALQYPFPEKTTMVSKLCDSATYALLALGKRLPAQLQVDNESEPHRQLKATLVQTVNRRVMHEKTPNELRAQTPARKHDRKSPQLSECTTHADVHRQWTRKSNPSETGRILLFFWMQRLEEACHTLKARQGKCEFASGSKQVLKLQIV